METANTKIIKETFQEISDLVTGTMGAKGRLAVLKQDMDRPLLTDDGVTVARKAYSMEGLKRLPAISMVEAASNTEKEAYDGTTLTVLLTNAFYQLGLKWIKPKILGGEGMHPQLAADKIEESAALIRKALKNSAKELKDNDVRNLATITTKIPAVGEIVESAYKLAGKQMNIVIEHDMNETETKVEHSEGIVLNSGYMSEVMRAFCNEKDKTVFTNAALVLLSEDMMSQTMLLNFIKSLPNEVPPLVFMITSKFNPESLKILLDLLVPNQKNGLKFQFVFLNEEQTDDLYLDIAAFTNGQIQDAALGTSNYLFGNCGIADRIEIERDKTTIVAHGDVSKRIEDYESVLKEKKFEIGVNMEATIRRRLSNLKTGLVKIKLACPTVTEYMTIRLKLDDAIGAVRKAFENGILPGAGKALFNLSFDLKSLKPVLEAPAKKILENAGYLKRFKELQRAERTAVIDVKSGSLCNAFECGIIDGFTSVDAAVKNASSIAASYLRSFVLLS